VGRVTSLTVNPDKGSVIVTYTIEHKYIDSFRIREDSAHWISTGLLGRAQLCISMGSPDAAIIPDGTIPMGESSADFSQTVTSGGETLDNAKGAPAGAKKLVITLNKKQEDILFSAVKTLKDNRGKIKQFIERMTKFADALNNAETTMGKLVKENTIHDQIDVTLETMNEKLPEIGDFAGNLNTALEENRVKVKNTIDDAVLKSQNMNEMMDAVAQSLESNKNNIKKSTDKLAEVTPDINRFLDDADRTTGGIVEKKGTPGKYIMDEELEKEIIKGLDSISEGTNAITQFTSNAGRFKTFLGFGMQSNALEWNTRADLYLKMVPRSSKEYLVGATFYLNYDKPEAASGLDPRGSGFDGSAFTGLLGWKFFNDSLTLRLGAIEGMPGVGLEYCFFHGDSIDTKKTPHITSLQLELRMMDKDYEDWETEYMARAFVKHDFGNGLIFRCGGENLFNTPRFVIGFACEWLDRDIKHLTGILGKARHRK